MEVNIIKVNVTRDEVKLDNNNYNLHLGENNVTKLLFNLSEEFNETTNKAIFRNDNKKILIEIPIIDNMCNMPPEILNEIDEKNSSFELRVYGYDILDSKIIRYSPDYTRLFLNPGSYIPGATESEEITPSQFEQYTDAMNKGLEEVNNSLKEIDKTNKTTIKNSEYAKEQGDYAKKQGDRAKSITEEVQIKLDNGEFNGKDGYKPVKGIDYFTSNEINEIESDVKTQVKEDLNFNETIDDITKSIKDIQTEQTTQNTQIEENKTDIANINSNLINYSLITETGKEIVLVIDNTNYKLYAQLKDKNGNILNNSNVIDLPIEQLVMSVDYDNTTKEIIITLQNGEVTKVPVGALISGLISESQLNTILNDYVKFTDAPNSNKAGAILSGNYGLQINGQKPYAEVINYSSYGDRSNETFISKGTLENVITGKKLVNKSYVDDLVGDIASAINLINGEEV